MLVCVQCISDCVTNLVPVATVTNYDPALGPLNQTLAPVKAQKSLFGEEWERTIYNVTNASGTYASVDTHGYNHNAGHVIGAFSLPVRAQFAPFSSRFHSLPLSFLLCVQFSLSFVILILDSLSFVCFSYCLHSQSHSLSLVLVVMMSLTEFKTSRSIHMLIL